MGKAGCAKAPRLRLANDSVRCVFLLLSYIGTLPDHSPFILNRRKGNAPRPQSLFIYLIPILFPLIILLLP